MRIIILVFILISSKGILSQVVSNKYFKVLQSVKDPIGRYHYLDTGCFAVNLNNEEKNSILVDTLGNKVDFPCNHFKHDDTMDPDLVYCHCDSLIGVFSTTKKKLITPLFDSIHSISQDFYSIRKDGHLLLFNRDHKQLYNAKVNKQLKSFYQVCDEKYIIIYEKIQKYINYSGELKKNYRCVRSREAFSDGSYIFLSDEKLGVKSEVGQELIPAKYEHIEEWKSGKYLVSIQILNTQETGLRSKYKRLNGIIDKQGNTILPIEYDYIYTYPYGLIGKKPDCKSVFLSESFDNVYHKEFESIRAAENGFILLKDGTDIYYDLAYDTKSYILQNGIETGTAITNQITELKLESGKHILVDRMGEIIFESHNEDVQFKKFNNTYIEVKFINSVGIMKKDGSWLVAPGDYRFKSMKRLKGFIAYDKKSNFTTLYNSKGHKIAENIKTATILTPRYAYVLSKEDKVGVIDDEGKTIIPFQYEKIDEISNRQGFYQITDKNNLHLVKIRK